uniref:ATP synthase complex subunit 8 n=2 Tax=Perloidea TaxID=70404 RepID=A0A0U2IB75_9NEOP|nr:ATP synthase F0 subunit 8 [Kamimuria wangi]ALF04104.1 ATP synthase F0 subunit 8 [Styloperla sp. YZD-2015]
MAPISWLSLFIVFSIVLLLFSSMNYYNFMVITPSTHVQQIHQTPMNWKW